MSTPTERRFGPTADVIPGWLGLLLALGLSVWTLATDHSVSGWRIVLGALLVATVIWGFMLRPRIIMRGDLVVLRNALSDWLIPVALIDEVQIRQVTRVHVRQRAYVAIGVGRKLRRMNRTTRTTRPSGPATAVSQRTTHLSTAELPDFVEDQILAAAKDAVREVAAGHLPDPGRVERRWAVLEIVLLVGLAIGLLLTFLH